MDVIRNATHVLKLFKVWPNDGGYLDQDIFLVEDMVMYQQLEDAVMKETRDTMKKG